MVFYFASPKYNPLINKVLTETDQVIAESIVGNDLFLKKTMKDKLASIASIDIIIVDFTALADTDAEIMEAVESIRIMDYKVRFIFVMPYKAEGDPFLKECFYAGIYDLIISDQYLEISEQLAVCVTEGMRYKDELIDKIQKGMDLQILNDGGDRAYYSPKTDSVHLPEKDTFYNSYAYNATALHELSHATGAEKRLNRDIRNVFGTEKYAYEELVAEISACFMSEHIQIEQTEEHVNNHKAYIQSWTKALSEKPEMLMKAIRDAEKAANYLEYHAEILSKEEYQETLTLHENEETPTPGNTSEKMVEKTANPITREADLKANGYKLTPALKKHMDRLDQLTGRKNSVKDIYKAYKTHDFHGDPETEKTIKSIGKIFQRQEMQIKAVIPER